MTGQVGAGDTEPDSLSIETLVVLVVSGDPSDLSACRRVAAEAECVQGVVVLNDAVLDILLPSTHGLADLAHALLAGCPSVTVGVSVGDVIVGPDSVDGLPVVEAARLSSMGMPGDVLVHPRILRLAPALRSQSIGAISLKGLPGEIDVRRLVPAD